ncbi:MAG: hypothetical protein HOI42_12970 [Candidatus Marinimicrobia bacterium]|nr:hypothetical protein [Candidatus Neomarinimicrobiota bacterium]MBT4852841.1 hypothetical protein [Candidatus Neomarinimicrobiota bacterium]MBT6217658.1 hypothetical protein [Candidatus Neomarinimicrobiota bacterium]
MKQNSSIIKLLLIIIFMFSANLLLLAAGNPEHGDVRYTQWGILDGNAVRTLYSNHSEVARWPDQPSGEWPKGTGHSYVDGVATIIAASTFDTQGNRIHPMSTNYREFIDTDPITKIPWGWAPLPGYSNPNQQYPARSDDEFTWPNFWPEHSDWINQWDGYFGRGIMNADVETFFVCDDSPDWEWFYPQEDGSGVFFPDPSDSTRGGLGMEVRARGFQWSHVLAQDVIFWHYEIVNEGTTDYDSVYFSQYIDWGIGGTADSGDDEGGYNKYLDISFAWDYNGVGQPGAWGPTGVAAYAFLESPGKGWVYDEFGNLLNSNLELVDEDDDGLVNESRNNPAGDWLSDYPYGVDDVGKFLEFYNREPRAHYEGDEDQDWWGFEDYNENGVWDQNEPLNDDVGNDGLAPYHSNYPGPDNGEGDGRPTSGEPNFNETDKDESDQLGLTGFAVFDVHQFELTNDELNWRDIFVPLAPPTDDIYLQGGRNLGMFFSSGPFPMLAGQTERFSMALVFANKDFPDAPNENEIRNSSLARKKETIQQIYNADYRFAQPPLKPNLNVIAGDGQVILHWDDRAEGSFDPFTKEFDFEGYKIYRSTEPFFNENLTITNTYGEPMFRQALAQWDLANGIEGLHPVDVSGLKYNLGIDSGLRHYYIDSDVINGMTYYYAVVSYDRGLVGIDADGNIQIDHNGHARGLSPSECASIIQQDISGNLETDINTVVVTPRSNAAGYVPGEITGITAMWDTIPSPATGLVDLLVIEEDSLKADHEYEIRFTENTSHFDEAVPLFSLTDITDDQLLLDSLEVDLYGMEVPIIDGLGIVLFNDSTVTVVDSASGWQPDRINNYDVTLKPLTIGDDLWGIWGEYTNINHSNYPRVVPYPADYLIIFENDTTFVDTSYVWSYPFLSPPIPVPFTIWNITEQRFVTFAIQERKQGDDNSYDNIWQPNEPIIILEGTEGGVEPVPSSGFYKVAWAIRLFTPFDETVTPVPPGSGDVIRLTTTKPFRNNETFRFSVIGAGVDENEAKNDMEDVYVVPNPYVAQSIFEPSNVYQTGRGERRIYFMNLPVQCTIKIYTKTGKLVDTIEHQGFGGDGQEPWDLVSKDGMNIAYGIYFYTIHGLDKVSTGKFAVIK